MNYLYTFFLACLLSAPLTAQFRFDALEVTFSQPTDLTFSGSDLDRLYVTEKAGRVYVYNLTDNTKTLWLDLSARVDSGAEGGLLGLAFHPDADSSYCYVNYTVAGDAGARLVSKISRFTAPTEGAVNLDTELNLLSVDQPATNHNAGDLAFGPDGYLYVPLGDGGGGFDPFENGQNPTSLLGKLLRLDVNAREGGRNYAIPADNPFATSADTLPEIWSLGLRNPWRISFDRLTGDLWIADVGQNAREEVNVQRAGNPGGQNYGWNCREGFIASARPTERYCGSGAGPFDAPELDYPHSGNEGVNGQSITGGFVYSVEETLFTGVYVFADFASPRFFLYDPAQPAGERLTVQTTIPLQNVSTFGEAANGELYVADYGGTIYNAYPDSGLSTGGPANVLELAVFPNPARESVTLTLPVKVTGGAVRLYDSTGKRVAVSVNYRGDDQVELSLQGLPSGLYLAEVMTAGVRATGRVIIR